MPEFLALMDERHRIRVRDGARHWTLMRDLGDPRLWLESYQTPTWVEYIRHNQRRTKADAANTDRLRALHRGAGPAASSAAASCARRAGPRRAACPSPRRSTIPDAGLATDRSSVPYSATARRSSSASRK